MRHGSAAVVALVGLAWGLVGCGEEERGTVATTREADVRLVYGAALRAVYSIPRPKLLVIDPDTKPGWSRKDVGDRVPDARSDTLDDFARQPGKGAVSREIDAGVPLDWLGYADWARRAEASWPGFDRLFPDALGWITFSDVGFSADRSQALLHVHRNGGPRDAEGYLVLLDKEDGSWRVRAKVMTTVS